MNEPTRVVHVTGCLEMGGQEKLLIEFARHADRRRFELRFVSLAGRGALAADLEALGWPVTALDAPPGLRPGLVGTLVRLFRAWGAQVVHTHNERPLIYAAPAAKLARVRRVIHTKHGRGTGNSRRQLWLTALAARFANEFVGVADDCARLAVAQGVPARRVRTLHNGIDTRRFAYRGPCPDGPAVLVARLCPEKDVPTLLDAVALAVSRRPDFRLQIAGDGICLPELRRRAAELNLDGHVAFLGMVDDVPALLAGARLLVLSSISEGVSLTLLEAMACGLPVIATRVGGTPEVVADGATGLLVPPRDPSALAAALLELYADVGRCRRLGEVGRRRVEESFDVRRMVARYERMYAGADQGVIEETSHDARDDAGSGGTDRSGRRAAVVAAPTGP